MSDSILGRRRLSPRRERPQEVVHPKTDELRKIHTRGLIDAAVSGEYNRPRSPGRNSPTRSSSPISRFTRSRSPSPRASRPHPFAFTDPSIVLENISKKKLFDENGANSSPKYSSSRPASSSHVLPSKSGSNDQPPSYLTRLRPFWESDYLINLEGSARPTSALPGSPKPAPRSSTPSSSLQSSSSSSSSPSPSPSHSHGSYLTAEAQARSVRSILELNILEVRALKNKTEASTFSQLLQFFVRYEALHGEQSCVSLLQEAIVTQLKAARLWQILRQVQKELQDEYDEQERLEEMKKNPRVLYVFLPFWKSDFCAEDYHARQARSLLKLDTMEAKLVAKFTGQNTIGRLINSLREYKQKRQVEEFASELRKALPKADQKPAQLLALLLELISEVNVANHKALEMVDMLRNSEDLLTRLEYTDDPKLDNDAIAVIVEALVNTHHPITYLDFSSNSIGETGALTLSELFRHKPTLIQAIFDDNCFGDAGAESMAAAIKRHSSGNRIHWLSMANNGIGKGGSLHLAALIHPQKQTLHMEVLKICHNRIEDFGAEQISGYLGGNRTLRYLDLSSTGISDKGMTLLFNALESNETLTHLNLSGNSISQRCLPSFARMLQKNRGLCSLKLGSFDSCDQSKWREVVQDGLAVNHNLLVLSLIFATSVPVSLQDLLKSTAPRRVVHVHSLSHTFLPDYPELEVHELLLHARLDPESAPTKSSFVHQNHLSPTSPSRRNSIRHGSISVPAPDLAASLASSLSMYASSSGSASPSTPSRSRPLPSTKPAETPIAVAHGPAPFSSATLSERAVAVRIDELVNRALSKQFGPHSLDVLAMAIFEHGGLSQQLISGLHIVHLVCLYGDLAAFEMVSALGADCSVRAHVQSGFPDYTPLHFAVRSGSVDVVKALLARSDVDVNAKEANDYTPLHLACQMGNADVTQELVAAKADFTIRNRFGHSAFHSCIKASKNSVAVLQKLLRSAPNGASDRNLLETKSHSGQTLVMLAIIENNGAVFDYLLSQGVDLNAKDDKNRTPLLHAIENAHEHFALRLLRDSSVNNRVKDNTGNNAAIYAARSGQINIMRELASMHASFTDANDNGNTPLHMASKQGHTEVVRWLLGRGLDPRTKNVDGIAPVHFACTPELRAFIQEASTAYERSLAASARATSPSS
eukprot:GILI01003477.1.p1 GENE.GILI01003477.1~~GILI01003477.1.p1  ORF type:complete len:1161 (+),score=322.43 GILI01003477.1:121-3603(+)